jgi:uncharacterized protein (DUF1501 family)
MSASSDPTLVCVFLRGGADTLNLVVPYGDDQYYKLRPTLAIPPPSRSGGAVRLDDFYAFHPKLAPLYPIFAEGRLAIVQAVGSDNVSGSHFEAQDQMEHGEAYGKSIGGGWLARFLRAGGGQQTPLSAVAIGATIPESLRGAPAASAIYSVDELRIAAPTGNSDAVRAVLARMYSGGSKSLSKAGEDTLDLLRRIEGIRSQQYRPEGGVQYPDNSFAGGLREIARLIKSGVGLRVASIDLGGWDTHFFQGTVDGQQAEVIASLAQGLAAFDADLAGYQDRVTVLVMTEFGRRIYENGSLGTDHGRGFAMMGIGNRVNGGKVIGDWPGLDEIGEDGVSGLIGPSGLKINHDYRSLLAEVLQDAMGCRDVAQVFPDFKPSPVGLCTRISPKSNPN